MRSGGTSLANLRTGLLCSRIPYIRGGEGARHAVVLLGANALFRPLHKATKPARYAAQVQRLLPPGYQFTIIGYEEFPADTCTLDSIADDVAKALHSLASRRALVLGISFGGFVAQRLAVRHPDLVDRLVIMVSAHRFSASGWGRMERQLQALEAGDLATLLRDNALLFRRPWYNWLVRLKLRSDRSRLQDQCKDPAAILDTYRSVFSDDFARNADLARQIIAPTFVLGGTADQYFDVEALRETAERIPGARLRLFERETHMLPLERSADVAREIAAFLGAQDR